MAQKTTRNTRSKTTGRKTAAGKMGRTAVTKPAITKRTRKSPAIN